jgi:hypothetical protein
VCQQMPARHVVVLVDRPLQLGVQSVTFHL